MTVDWDALEIVLALCALQTPAGGVFRPGSGTAAPIGFGVVPTDAVLACVFIANVAVPVTFARTATVRDVFLSDKESIFAEITCLPGRVVRAV